MKIVHSRKTNIYILSFIIPVIVMIAVFAILKIFPFGENTVMTGDTTYQLVDYLSYYKTILSGNNDFAYSLSKNIGGEMAGFAAYYLYSPLNLLTLPFPKEYLFAGIGLIIILVPGLASLSMCYALKHIKEDNGGVLVFAVCYGLSAYVIVYNELLYYYTNIILLPLIVLFLRNIEKENRFISLRYIVLLAFIIINNYYTGYMICIFLLIYYIYYLTVIYEGNNRPLLFFRFAADSVLGALLSCVTLIPAVLSLTGEKNDLSVGLYLTFSPLNYFSKLYSGSFAGDFGAGLPNIYCGTFITVLLAVIVMNKDISRKKRAGIVFMLVFFWVDFFINTLNVFWHGLNQPIGFPYRQAFVVVFFCIITAYENTDLSITIRIPEIAVLLAAFMLYSVFIILRKIDNADHIVIAVTGAALVCSLAVLYLPVKSRLFLLFLITLSDLTFNAAYSLSHFYFTTIEEYQEPLSLISSAVENVGDDRGDVFRMEKEFRRTNNDAMMLDYAGLTHFSSSEKKETLRFMGKLGFRDNGNWAMYTGINTALADSILGVRYLLSQFDATGKPYTRIYDDNNGEYYIYRNPYAVPVLSAVNDDVFEVSLGEDPFDNQNKIADAMTGTENHILYPQKAKRKDGPAGEVSFDVEIQNDGILYCYFTAPMLQDAALYMDGEELTEYFSVYNWTTVELYERKKGDTVHIDLISKNSEPVEVDEGYFAVIDYDNLKKWNEEIEKQETFVCKKTSSYYEGYYDSDKETLLFSVPMDKGWHLYLDRKEYEVEEACGHLIAARVPPGKHEVIFRFIPPGRRTGQIVSAVTLLMLLIYCVWDRFNPQYLGSKNNTK